MNLVCGSGQYHVATLCAYVPAATAPCDKWNDYLTSRVSQSYTGTHVYKVCMFLLHGNYLTHGHIQFIYGNCPFYLYRNGDCYVKQVPSAALCSSSHGRDGGLCGLPLLLSRDDQQRPFTRPPTQTRTRYGGVEWETAWVPLFSVCAVELKGGMLSSVSTW